MAEAVRDTVEEDVGAVLAVALGHGDGEYGGRVGPRQGVDA